jgi:hypothetical protein
MSDSASELSSGATTALCAIHFLSSSEIEDANGSFRGSRFLLTLISRSLRAPYREAAPAG